MACCCELILFSCFSLLIQDFCTITYKTTRPDLLGAGPMKLPTLAVLLAPFLVRRHSGFRYFGEIHRLHVNEVAFLFLVLLVSAGIDVVRTALDNRLIGGG